MRNDTQHLLPLADNRKLDRQVATDHMVRAAFEVKTIISIFNRGGIETLEFDYEISPSFALIVIGNQVRLETYDVDEDELSTEPLVLWNSGESESLTFDLDTMLLPLLIEEVKTFRYEREEYLNEEKEMS